MILLLLVLPPDDVVGAVGAVVAVVAVVAGVVVVVEEPEVMP